MRTHCDHCGRVLGQDCYRVSPATGSRTLKGWCPDCYQRLVTRLTRERVKLYAGAGGWGKDDPADDDMD
jgi:hypothetical protein